MVRLLAFLGVFWLCSSAMACINDNESPQHEREFRSDYSLAEMLSAEPPTAPLDNRYLVAGGLMLLTGAFAVALSPQQTRSKPWPRASADLS
jgi:hypothetical protein